MGDAGGKSLRIHTENEKEVSFRSQLRILFFFFFTQKVQDKKNAIEMNEYMW